MVDPIQRDIVSDIIIALRVGYREFGELRTTTWGDPEIGSFTDSNGDPAVVALVRYMGRQVSAGGMRPMATVTILIDTSGASRSADGGGTAGLPSKLSIEKIEREIFAAISNPRERIRLFLTHTLYPQLFPTQVIYDYDQLAAMMPTGRGRLARNYVALIITVVGDPI